MAEIQTRIAKPGSRGLLLPLGLLLAIILISRLPFIFAGYGLEVDSWRVANAAREISLTGEYVGSRSPGHPVQEYICSLFWRLGPGGLNGLSMIFQAVASISFALLLRSYRFKNWILGAAAFSFVPVLYLSSVASKDYLWALGFILLSTYLVRTKHDIAAGLMLALAIGSRITSVVMLLPLIIMLLSRWEKSRWPREIFIFTATSLVLGVITYYPVLQRYGIGYFPVAEKEYPTPLEIFITGAINVWGILGLAGLLIALVCMLVGLRKKSDIAERMDTPRLDVIAWLVAVLIYLIMYFRLPYHAGYLAPMIPFLLLLIFRYTPKAVFVILCFSIIISPFILGFIPIDQIHKAPGNGVPVKLAGQEYQLFPDSGFVMLDLYKRMEMDEYIRGSITFAEGLLDKSIIVTGSLGPIIKNFIPEFHLNNAEFVYLLNEEELSTYQRDGFGIYYLRGAVELNKYTYNIDLKAHGASHLQ